MHVTVESLDELIESGKLDHRAIANGRSLRPVEESAEKTASRIAIQRFIESLSASDRALIESVYWQGKSQADFARQSGLSRMAITKRLKKIYNRAAIILSEFDSKH